MKRAIFVSILLLIWLVLMGCGKREEPIKVSVLFTGAGVDLRLAQYSAGKPRTSSGRRVDAFAMNVRPDDLVHFATKVSPVDIIVCESPEQFSGNPALQRDAENGIRLCNTGANCLAFIPSSVGTGDPEKQEAVKQVFRAITVH